MPRFNLYAMLALCAVLLNPTALASQASDILVAVVPPLSKAEVKSIMTASQHWNGHRSENFSFQPMVGTSEQIIRAAKLKNMKILVAPSERSAGICPTLLRHGFTCRGMKQNNKIMFMSKTHALTQFTELFENPDALHRVAVVVPPTVLLASFLKWSGVPENQIAHLLSSQRGFDYAYRALFPHGAETLWCSTASAALAALTAGKAAAILAESSGIDFSIYADRDVSNLGAMRIWESDNVGIPGSNIVWFDLTDKDSSINAQEPVQYGYEHFDFLEDTREDFAWRTAADRAFEKLMMSRYATPMPDADCLVHISAHP